MLIPLKSPQDASKLLRLLPTLELQFRQALSTLPEVHYFRCVLVTGGSDLALIATIDGAVDDFLDDFITAAGTLIDQLLEFASPPVPLPVSLRRADFKQYVKEHNAPAPFWYSATPPSTAAQLLASAKTAGMDGGDPLSAPTQNTLCAIFEVLSPNDAAQLRGLMMQAAPQVLQAFSAVGTVHFARFLFLKNETQFGIITVFDGTFEKYSRDFVNILGQVFDALLAHVVGGDSSLIPVKDHFDQFHKIVASSNYAPPSIWYCAYPKLTTPNVQTLGTP
jgi:hypothetical protein